MDESLPKMYEMTSVPMVLVIEMRTGVLITSDN
jgi:hypothetical protein